MPFAFTSYTISIKCTAVTHSMAFPHIWIFSPVTIHRRPVKRSVNTSHREKLRGVLNAARRRAVYFHRRAKCGRSAITQQVVGPTPSAQTVNRWCAHAKIRIDGIMPFTPRHLKFKLTWINGVRVLQNCELSVCIHYGSNKVCWRASMWLIFVLISFKLRVNTQQSIFNVFGEYS